MTKNQNQKTKKDDKDPLELNSRTQETVIKEEQATNEKGDANTKQTDSSNLPQNTNNITEPKGTSLVGSVVDFTGKALITASCVVGGYFAYINRDKIIETFNKIGGFIGLIFPIIPFSNKKVVSVKDSLDVQELVKEFSGQVPSENKQQSILEIKNMTGKKITITGTKNLKDGYLGYYDKQFNKNGVIGYGLRSVIQGEKIDPSWTLVANNMQSIINSIHSFDFLVGEGVNALTNNSVSFFPRSVNFFDRELENQFKARDYIALPQYKKNSDGVKTLSISLYSPEVKVEECDMPMDNGERDKKSFPISFTIKNNTNSDITINNVQSYIEAYAKCTGTPWQFINCTIKSKESVQKKMLYNAELNEDGKLAARTDKCLAFYYSKHDLSKNNYGKFFCGDVYTFGKKKYSDDKLNININSTSDSVVIDLYEPDQVKFTGES